ARELAALERHRGRAEELGTRAAKQAATAIDATERRLSSAGARLAPAEHRRPDASGARLRAPDPARILERRYTGTPGPDGRVVKRVSGLSTGDELVTEFSDGAAASVVQEIDKRE